ncbi:tumor necrosis factor receptor superfamily member 1B-like [Heteronotia binoei]|uniref:tumor necrosis factor receptor superfamily member 1B-like n=1 Tax=Heteronotia binoei TaxID=13085 RepID=UPI00292D5683|nr:tumor necrosis factor receptor superfamily member 1B-like [Heteronotia binoei]
MGRWRRCCYCSLRLLGSALLLLLEAEAQVPSLPYRPEHPRQCQDSNNEYYNQTAHRCCHFCPPGFRVRHHCNESINTQCEACEENTFTKTLNSAVRCLGCSPKCRTGLVEIQECTRTQDRHCWCPPHEFCSTVTSKTCFRCQPYQRCSKGFGVAKPGTKSSNVECAPCEPGTFSDVESHSATCRTHRVCDLELHPGNSTNDAVCKDSSGDILNISPLPTVKIKEPSSPGLSASSTPSLDMDSSLQKPPRDIAYIIGGLAISLFALVAFIGAFSCIISQKKALHCKKLLRGEQQPFSSVEQGPDKWPRVSSHAGQEEENLLKISPSSSGSLDCPPASDKSSGTDDLDDPPKEVEASQQRSSLSNSCVYHSRANSKQPGTGGTHVNISCVVNVCNPDHSLQFQSLNSSPDPDASVGEDVPLSKEESPIQRASEGQTAVEVEEDNTDVFAYEEKKPLPLSIQDVGMKTR